MIQPQYDNLEILERTRINFARYSMVFDFRPIVPHKWKLFEHYLTMIGSTSSTEIF